MGVSVLGAVLQENSLLNSSASAGANPHKTKKLEISGIRLTKCSVLGPLQSGVRSSANARFFQIFLLDRWHENSRARASAKKKKTYWLLTELIAKMEN